MLYKTVEDLLKAREGGKVKIDGVILAVRPLLLCSISPTAISDDSFR